MTDRAEDLLREGLPAAPRTAAAESIVTWLRELAKWHYDRGIVEEGAGIEDAADLLEHAQPQADDSVR